MLQNVRRRVRTNRRNAWMVCVALLFLHRSKACLAEALSTEEESASTLVFSSKCQLVSGPLTTNPKELREFLERPEIRDLFLSTGGERPCQPLPKDEKMMDLWRSASRRHYGPDALPPSASDSTNIDLRATETSIQFPGFTTFNTVVSGCQRIPSTFVHSNLNRDHSNLRERPSHANTLAMTTRDKNPQLFEGPVHRFYLIADKKRWEGPMPLMWIIRKFADQDGTRSKSFQPTETRATTAISVVTHQPPRPLLSSSRSISELTNEQQQEEQLYGFQLDVDFSIQMEFPKILWRWLPASRSQVEDRGNNAVQEVVLQDARLAVAAVQDAWTREQQEKGHGIIGAN
jgi:hypothetical protein